MSWDETIISSSSPGHQQVTSAKHQSFRINHCCCVLVLEHHFLWTPRYNTSLYAPKISIANYDSRIYENICNECGRLS